MNTLQILHHTPLGKGFPSWPGDNVQRHVERRCRVTPPVAIVIAELAFGNGGRAHV